jgi:uncharacterized protein DUF6285
MKSAATIDPPRAAELLLLVAEFLSSELAPAQSNSKLRYRTLVAANLLRIASREWEGLDALQEDRDGNAVSPQLIEAVESLRLFADELSAGRRSLTEPETFALVYQHVENKLRIAAPEMLSNLVQKVSSTPNVAVGETNAT